MTEMVDVKDRSTSQVTINSLFFFHKLLNTKWCNFKILFCVK